MSRTLTANGNIRVCRFVEFVGSTSDYMVTECNGANDKMAGISCESGREAPLPAVSTMYAAQQYDSLKVYTVGDRDVLLELGGDVVPGAYLASDNQGRGVTASTDETYGARALEAGASGERIRVDVIHGSTESS